MPKTFQNKRLFFAVLFLLGFKILFNIVSFITLEYLDSNSLNSFSIVLLVFLSSGSGGLGWAIINIVYLVLTLALPVFFVLFAINQTGARFAAVMFLIIHVAEAFYLLLSALFYPLFLLSVLYNLVVVGLLIYLLRQTAPFPSV